MLSLLAAASLAFTIPDSEVIDLPTASNGVDYQLYVHVPPACREPQAKCPAVYMLDAEYSFALAATIVTHLADRQRIRPIVSVAIGYQDKSKYRYNRTRDYTPFPDSTPNNDPSRFVSGEGPAFRRVFAREIFPFVEASYPVLASNRTLIGHSYGGLFAVSTMIEEPDLFDNYLIVSPSLWYGEGRMMEQLRLASPDRKMPMRVYLAVGDWEQQPQTMHPMVGDARTLGEVLDRWGQQQVEYELAVLPEESHASVFPAALSNGLRKLFGVAFNPPD